VAGLERFIDAQQGVWETALAELEVGRKQTHWMWFIFPQLADLGRSERARYYGIRDLGEARDYLADPVLSARLAAATRAVLKHSTRPADAIMGSVDAMKLRSCATLFLAAGGGEAFQDVLDTFYGGQPCALTQQLLDKSPLTPR
jgi:uncharacterized protein (DUF1810 family)